MLGTDKRLQYIVMSVSAWRVVKVGTQQISVDIVDIVTSVSAW